MQMGKKGVNGPAQKARQAVATPRHHLISSSAYKRYSSHTGEYTTAITISRMANVRQSWHSCQRYLQNFLVLRYAFCHNPLAKFSIFDSFFDVLILSPAFPTIFHYHRSFGFFLYYSRFLSGWQQSLIIYALLLSTVPAVSGYWQNP